MCSSTPLSTAIGAVPAGCWGEGCMVRVKGLPLVRTRSERRFVVAGGRLRRLAAPTRPVAAAGLGRRGLGRGGLGGRPSGGGGPPAPPPPPRPGPPPPPPPGPPGA